MCVAGGASFSRSHCGHSRTYVSPSEPPSLPAPSASHRRRGQPQDARAGWDWAGRCLQTSSVTNLLEGCWQFFLFSTTLLFLMIVHNQCICFPCSSSKGVSL